MTHSAPTSLPNGVTGSMSPYPTVVIVTTAVPGAVDGTRAVAGG